MSRCSETLTWYTDTTKKHYIEAACDLTDHSAILPLHLDRRLGIEWRVINDDPTPVESTRTAPRKPFKLAKVSTTSAFELVRL